MALTRRAFVARTAVVLGATSTRLLARAEQGGLDAFGGSEPPCGPEQTLTPALPADGTFRPGAPQRTSLATPGFQGQTITMTGTVAGVKCGRIKGARLDFWQADAQGRYEPAGFSLRGYQVTDASGHYSLVTPVPGAAPGRAPHVSIRVSIAGKPDFWTEAFLPNDPRNAKDPRFRSELAMRRTAAGYVFDITLNM